MIQSLQSLRFVFIMLVVMSHIIGKSFDFGGECGVSFFFILSGFILSYAYGNKVETGTFRHGAFILKQLSKFYPLHLLTFVIMVALDSRLGVFYSWDKLVANLLLLQSWVPSDNFYFVGNGLSWFLSDLLFFYAMFPLVFRWSTKTSLSRLSIVGLILLVLYVWLAVSIPDKLINPLLYASPLTRLIDFTIGIWVYRFWVSDSRIRLQRRLDELSPIAVTLLELVMVAAVVASFFVYEESSLRFRCASLFWLILPFVLLVFVMTDQLSGLLTRVLHHPAMLWLGGISLEIYLIHYVLMRILYSILLTCGVDETARLSLPVILLTLAVILVMSYLTKRFFVTPIFNQLVKRIRQK